MALELFAAVTAAFALAGIALLLRKLTGQRLPKWIVPVAAGLGMVGYTIWSEYSWYPRSVAALPPGVTVVSVDAQPSGMRPWTMVAPVKLRFLAMDLRAGAQHPVNADLRLVRLFAFARWQPVRDTAMVFDCAQGAQVLLQPGIEITADGQLISADWVTPGTADEAAMLATACNGPAAPPQPES